MERPTYFAVIPIQPPDSKAIMFIDLQTKLALERGPELRGHVRFEPIQSLEYELQRRPRL